MRYICIDSSCGITVGAGLKSKDIVQTIGGDILIPKHNVKLSTTTFNSCFYDVHGTELKIRHLTHYAGDSGFYRIHELTEKIIISPMKIFIRNEVLSYEEYRDIYTNTGRRLRSKEFILDAIDHLKSVHPNNESTFDYILNSLQESYNQDVFVHSNPKSNIYGVHTHNNYNTIVNESFFADGKEDNFEKLYSLFNS